MQTYIDAKKIEGGYIGMIAIFNEYTVRGKLDKFLEQVLFETEPVDVFNVDEYGDAFARFSEMYVHPESAGNFIYKYSQFSSEEDFTAAASFFKICDFPVVAILRIDKKKIPEIREIAAVHESLENVLDALSAVLQQRDACERILKKLSKVKEKRRPRMAGQEKMLRTERFRSRSVTRPDAENVLRDDFSTLASIVQKAAEEMLWL